MRSAADQIDDMRLTATITVTSGPDRGRVFECGDEVLHIGRGIENQIVLEDADLQEHQASLVRREGRYAIYTPLREAVDVNGSTIPPDQWVWLPPGGRVRLGRRTVLEISMPEGEQPSTPVGGSSPTGSLPDVDTPTPPRPRDRSNGARRATSDKKRPRAGGNSQRVVARFVTDAQGVSRVQLGEDGQLPALTLSEAAERVAGERKQERGAAQVLGSSALLYMVLGCSLLASTLLLLIEAEPDPDAALTRAQALRAVVDYYGDEQAEPLPYQELLREAALARSRGDELTARESYRRVLTWLRAEDNNRGTPLTGSRARDRELRDLLTILLAH